MKSLRRYLLFFFFTLLFALRYWTVGTWVRLKWHYCRWRGVKYYL
ncbi:MAG: hypothetical protein V3T81_07430 [Thermoanaerobaculia bacterium]